MYTTLQDLIRAGGGSENSAFLTLREIEKDYGRGAAGAIGRKISKPLDPAVWSWFDRQIASKGGSFDSAQKAMSAADQSRVAGLIASGAINSQGFTPAEVAQNQGAQEAYLQRFANMDPGGADKLMDQMGYTNSLSPNQKAAYQAVEQTLQQKLASGQVINPNVTLDESRLAEFLSQAEKEIDPYYAGQLKLARESLEATIGQSREALTASELDTERAYGRSLRTLGENAAEQGFAQSGLRARDEADLATETQSKLDSSRRTLASSLGNSFRSYAQKFGTQNLPSFDLGQAPVVAPGQGNLARTTKSLGLYELSPSVYDGLVGSEEFARRGAVKSRASELEGAYRTRRTLPI